MEIRKEGDVKTTPSATTREHFLELYEELFQHLPPLEEAMEQAVRWRKVNQAVLQKHLTRMMAAMLMSHGRHATQRYRRKSRRGAEADVFHNQMVKITRVIRSQLEVLVESIPLLDRRAARREFFETLSDMAYNIISGYQYLLRVNVLLPVGVN